MNKFARMIYLIYLLSLSFSCVKNKSSVKEIHKSEFASTSKTDTLKFTTGIRCIFQDSKGNYWFGTNEDGVGLFDGKSFRYFTKNEGLSDNQVRSIQEDAYGNIWFEAANRVCSYNGKIITNYNPGVNFNLPGQWKKTENDLWFNAGNKEGINRFDGKKLQYLAFPKPKTVNPNNRYAVTDIAKGKNDFLWIATYAGVFGYNGDQFTIINDESLAGSKGMGELHVRSILEDSRGRLWIGNNGIGVLLKDGDTTINFSEKHNLIHPTSSRSGDKSPPGTLEHVFAIEEDGNGNIWFGDRDTGAWKYDGNTMSNYTKDEGLTNNGVFAIYTDRIGELWIGLGDGNVFKFNGKTFDQQF
ncbi:MAG: diguanylate cyclase [Saprospiraceae bacterium]|nr:diguanylate cyclase [Saprospiraceae bacterium]